MGSYTKFFFINLFASCLGIIYYYIYMTQSILICYAFCVFEYIMLTGTLHYNIKDNLSLSDRQYNPNIYDILNILKLCFLEIISIILCFKYKSNNIFYEIITFIPKTFIFELCFDFFHYWIHRMSHNKYLYINHKIHHIHTSNISIFSTFQHHFIDYILSNVFPMYISSCICPLYEYQFFIFLVFKLIVEMTGHAGKIINSGSFIQCVWIPQLLGIELYASDHYIHHTKFKYNYAKRFKIWDQTFGTYKTDHKIIEKELTIFNRQIKPIRNKNIRYILFLLILIIGYFV